MYNGTLPAISNRADWIGTLELINDDTGEIITDLSGVTFRLELRDNTCRSAILIATFETAKLSMLAKASSSGISLFRISPASVPAVTKSALRSLAMG